MSINSWIEKRAINVVTSDKFTAWADARIAKVTANVSSEIGQSVDKAGDAVRADIAAFFSTDLPKIPGQIISGVLQGIPGQAKGLIDLLDQFNPFKPR